jgi:hypothetical protein
MSNENMQSPEDECVITSDPNVILLVDWGKKQFIGAIVGGKKRYPGDFDRHIYTLISEIVHKHPLSFERLEVKDEG